MNQYKVAKINLLLTEVIINQYKVAKANKIRHNEVQWIYIYIYFVLISKATEY